MHQAVGSLTDSFAEAILWTHAGAGRARSFYRKSGWSETGAQHQESLWDGVSYPAVQYGRTLTALVRGVLSASCITGDMGQGVCPLESSEDRFIDTLRQRPYSVLIFSSLSRLAIMDSRTELVPLIHDPPSRRDWRISSDKGP
jgi:hypothetical protein